MRRFMLVRDRDPSGVSGTGVVAEGVEFSSGWVVVHWPSSTPSTATYVSVDDVRRVHGHHGSTRVRWVDVVETTPVAYSASASS